MYSSCRFVQDSLIHIDGKLTEDKIVSEEFLCECQIEQNLFNLNAFVIDFRFLCTI